ncbi:hydrogenase maturation nickel metallochaperone HypA [Nitrosomonas supralitoralis]|uniref:Hydrogenase maturation factor HypA n=1 Tax=Nitrosomonas supralitoralis TaxID=2116706 RepID=A0A2P7NY79_9PROT|nr:hydrogenase maturation nickel metallochaperone HypA [Nitrosomonas supralitoralis]PSJ18413.1 hydrogenase maturation nickel metallochaperone HypA [Nitrosomonas supralitoralis]
MHELSLAENLLQIIEESATEQHFTKIKTVWLEIGELACVEQESLRFFFDVVSQDSLARQAKLEIIKIAGQAVCTYCNLNCLISTYYEACPHCGSYTLKVIQGCEIKIKELEVE